MAKVDNRKLSAVKCDFLASQLHSAFILVVSPKNKSLNASFGLNSSLNTSPNEMNMSDRFKFLMPQNSMKKHRYSWSPLNKDNLKSPNVSPIKNGGESPSNFIKRRDPK